jgi:hypothetical protein
MVMFRILFLLRLCFFGVLDKIRPEISCLNKISELRSHERSCLKALSKEF